MKAEANKLCFAVLRIDQPPVPLRAWAGWVSIGAAMRPVHRPTMPPGAPAACRRDERRAAAMPAIPRTLRAPGRELVGYVLEDLADADDLECQPDLEA
jgi:hypothetical protein